jgi:hypothetical protein
MEYPVTDEVLRLVHAFDDVGRKDAVRKLAERVRLLEVKARCHDTEDYIFDIRHRAVAVTDDEYDKALRDRLHAFQDLTEIESNMKISCDSCKS